MFPLINKVKSGAFYLPASLIALYTLLPDSVLAQQTGWEKPITTYATNLLSGVVNVVSGVLILAFIVLGFWGFFAQDNRKFWWAAGCVVGAVLAQITPVLFKNLTIIGG